MRISQRIAFLISILPLFSSSTIFAASPTLFSEQHPYFVMLDVGAAFANDVGQSQYLPANESVFTFFDYHAQQQKQSQPLLGFFIGREFSVDPMWSVEAGLTYHYLFALHPKGLVTQGVDVPSSNQFEYQYNIQSQQVLVAGKFLWHKEKYHPYFFAGLGTAINAADEYEVNIVPAFTTFSNQFSNKTTTAFSYSLGVGIDVNLLPCTRVGLGYQFSNLGRVSTGNATIDDVSTNNKLSQSHLYFNQIQIQVTHFIF